MNIQESFTSLVSAQKSTFTFHASIIVSLGKKIYTPCCNLCFEMTQGPASYFVDTDKLILKFM